MSVISSCLPARSPTTAPFDSATGAEWRNVFERWTSGMVICGPDLEMVYVNPWFCKAMGYDREELLGHGFLGLVHEDDREACAGYLHALAEGHRHSTLLEVRCRRRDGSDAWERISASSLRGGDPEGARIVAVVEDRTDRHRAEEAVRTSERRFRQLAESMPFIVWTALPDGSVEYFTEPLVDYTGLDRDVLGTGGWIEAIHPDDVEAATSAWERAVDSLGEYATEFRFRRHDAVYRWHLARAIPVRDAGGHVTHWYGSLLDIHDRRVQEERNRQLAERLTTTLESITDAFFTLDREWRFTYVNREAERLLERDREELLGRHIWEEFPQAKGTRSDEMYTRAMETGQSVHFVQFYPPLDRWLDARAFPSTEGLAVYFRDVTADRRAAELIRENSERFQRVARATADAIWDWDLRTDAVWWSDGLQRTFGIPRPEVAPDSSSWSDRVHPDDRERVLAGIGKVMDGSADAWEDHYRFRRGDGSWAEVHDRAFVVRDEEGRPVRMVGGVSDETARVLAERRVREQAELLAKAKDAILVRSPDHRIVYWNAGAERLYGWSEREALGRSAEELLYDDPGAFLEANDALMERGEWTGELEQRRKDGSWITVEGHWTLVSGDDRRPSRILAINTDVTERKKLLAQFLRAQRLESIGTLAGGIAHDLNNVLAPILLSIEMLKLDTDDPETLTTLDQIEGSARRGADMVRQVLSFARGVEGARISVDISRIVDEVGHVVRETFPRNITLSTDIPAGLWPVLGDPTQIHQVFLNLFVNARDAMPKGGRLDVRAENVDVDEHYARLSGQAAAGRYVKVSVVDTGEGMPPDVLDQVFDPFFTTKEQGKGTGLGLSTVSAIVRGHGGFVHAYSEQGKGSTFRFYLPASERPEADGPDSDGVPQLQRGSGELILVVDDEAAVRDITRQTLEAFGYRVLTATDGADAVATYGARGSEIDLVLTDIMMPIMDGPALVRALRRMDPDVRIVAASGIGQHGGVERAADSGVRDFLPKPYTAATLLEVLARALARD